MENKANSTEHDECSVLNKKIDLLLHELQQQDCPPGDRTCIVDEGGCRKCWEIWLDKEVKK